MTHIVSIHEINFKKLLDGTKHAVATDDARPALRYIKLHVKPGNVTAYSCDGYRGAKIEVGGESDSEFECYIEPFDFKLTKSKMVMVTVAVDDDSNYTEVVFGTVSRTFKNPGNYPNIERLFEDARSHDHNIGVNENYVAQACKALSLVTAKLDPVVLLTKDSKTAPFLIVGKSLGCLCEQLIMPVRLGPELENL